MTRKDSEKDSERPHYYSQFWLDVAAGRRVIGGPRPEEGETEASESAQQQPTDAEEAQASNDADDFFARPATTTINRSSEEDVEPDTRGASDVNDEEPYQEEAINDLDIPDMDIESFNEGNEGEEEDEEYYEEEEEEEDEEEDMNWGRGRKKGKTPRTANKLPPKKPGRRDQRRSF